MTKTYTDKELIEILQNRAKELDRTPKYKDFVKTRNPFPSVYLRRFGSWNDALREAGLPINKESPQYSDEELISILQNKAKELGRTPKQREISFTTALRKHFGSFSKALEKAKLSPLHIFNVDSLKGILKAYYDRISRTMSDETVMKYMAVLTDLEDYLKSRDLSLEEVDFKVLIDYFDILKERGAFNPSKKSRKRARPNSPRTLGNKYRVVHKFLKWTLRYCKKLSIDPIIDEITILDIEDEVPFTLGKNEYDTERRALRRDEVIMIRPIISEDFYDSLLFDINVNLGLRISEICKMRIKDIKKEKDFSYVVVRGKGNKLRDVVLTDAQVSLIEKMLAYRELNDVQHDHLFFTKIYKNPPSKSAMNKIYQEITKKIQINEELKDTEITAHILRYTMVSYLEDARVTEKVIMQRLGHAGSGATSRYGRKQMLEQKQILEEKCPYI